MIVHDTQVSGQNSAYKYESNVKSLPKGAILLCKYFIDVIILVYLSIYFIKYAST